jgi:hypothetical protein
MASVAFDTASERRRSKTPKAVLGLALLATVAVALVTLCPIALRPHLASANLERLAAYAALGVLISRAAGRRGMRATALVVVLAFGLEASQRLAPGRHAQMADALVKAFGGVAGVVFAQLMFPLRRLISRLAGLRDPAEAPAV